MIDLLFNFLLLMFWVRLLPPEQENTYFNPYIAWINRVSRMVLNKLRQGMPHVSPFQLAALVFGGLLVARGLIAGDVRFGFELRGPVGAWRFSLLLSAVSFVRMLFYLWVIATVLAPDRGRHHAMSQCLRFLARPLPAWSPPRRWLTVIGLGLVISGILLVMPRTLHDGAAGIPEYFVMRSLVNTAAALVDVLAILQALLLAAVIGSWITLLAPSDGLGAFCHDAMILLLGPLRNYRLAIGTLDLTPLLAVVALMLLHGLLSAWLRPLYLALMTAG